MRDGDIARLCAELAARFFRGLFEAWDLHEIRGVHLAVPKGTPVLAGGTLSEAPGRSASTPAAGTVPGRPPGTDRLLPPRPAGCPIQGGRERTVGEENWPPQESQPRASGPGCWRHRPCPPGWSVRGTGAETQLKHYSA